FVKLDTDLFQYVRHCGFQIALIKIKEQITWHFHRNFLFFHFYLHVRMEVTGVEGPRFERAGAKVARIKLTRVEFSRIKFTRAEFSWTEIARIKIARVKLPRCKLRFFS